VKYPSGKVDDTGIPFDGVRVIVPTEHEVRGYGEAVGQLLEQRRPIGVDLPLRIGHAYRTPPRNGGAIWETSVPRCRTARRPAGFRRAPSVACGFGL
jgi:hypothetical protein